VQLLSIRKGINNCMERGGNFLREAFRRLRIGFPTRASLADLDSFGATALRLVFAIAPFLLEVLAFFVVFETVHLRVVFAIVDPQCRYKIVVRA
jgi:hypothetical protein